MNDRSMQESSQRLLIENTDEAERLLRQENFGLAAAKFRENIVQATRDLSDADCFVFLRSITGLIEALEAQGLVSETLRVLEEHQWILDRALAYVARSEERALQNGVLRHFDITEASAAIRNYGKKALNAQDLASYVANQFYSNLRTTESRTKVCALARFFKTVRFDDLTPELQKIALGIAPKLESDSRCLVLLGTAGERKQWNSIGSSAHHRVIPLVSSEMVNQSPMIARLFTELGFDISSLFRADKSRAKLFLDPSDQDYNIFYVPEASESPYIVAQNEFVAPERIRSVAGFGSMLPDGELYAVILFFRIFVDKQTAMRFSGSALSATIALLSLKHRKIFADT